ncbi:unnamed protein product [Fusarium graminearum]|nr:unnamed protein product [Fusarium graminearum]CAG1975395.1 unnamed protein product [Fusarium graminearum]
MHGGKEVAGAVTFGEVEADVHIEQASAHVTGDESDKPKKRPCPMHSVSVSGDPEAAAGGKGKGASSTDGNGRHTSPEPRLSERIKIYFCYLCGLYMFSLSPRIALNGIPAALKRQVHIVAPNLSLEHRPVPSPTVHPLAAYSIPVAMSVNDVSNVMEMVFKPLKSSTKPDFGVCATIKEPLEVTAFVHY